MPGAKAMIDQARKSIGVTEHPPGSNHNYITTWYGFDGAWCDMSVSYWAFHSGNEMFVCPRGKRAWTVLHAQDGKEVVGTWHKGTAENIKEYGVPGSIIFFDWAGSDNINAIDHVGVIEKNLGDGRVVTIEGNTSDVCARRVRGSSVIAGFFVPKYPAEKPKPAPKPPVKGNLAIPDGDPPLHLGSVGKDVYDLQRCLNRVSGSKLDTDGIYGKLTQRAVVLFQGKHVLAKDGVYGMQTAGKLRTSVKAS